MDAADVKFEIALLLKRKLAELIKDNEARHGPCRRELRGAITIAFYKAYSPRKWWDDELDKFRVIGDAVYWIRDWRVQETYIMGFSRQKVVSCLGEQGKKLWAEWMKKRR